MVFLFFVSIFFIFHAYFGYPLSLLLIRIFGKNQRKRHPVHLPATLIITVYNEEKRIKEKLDNTLKLNYPEGNLQILVASDGSDDGTNDIVKAYEKYGVELLEVVNRGGKENAQKEAIPHARGEILIFSDVATKIEPQGLMEIVSNFADPSVGCVSSEDRLIDRDGKPSGEGLYVRYEMWLRLLESQVNTLVGLSGSFFAARKQVCQDFSGEVQSDFRTLLSSVKIGLKGVSDPKAIGYYLDIADEKKEFDRKIRTVLRGLTVFFNHLEFLNIKKYGLFSYQLFCHKLLRWLVPFFLFSAFVSNALLIFSPLFFILFLCQFVFYGLAVYGWKIHLLKGIFKIPMFFMIVNAAIAVAWWQFFSGKRIVLWTPSRR
ncbi:MAG: glycosyltransferase family 2 protein [Proteobacteria bacterium]|nr:glycosyltransferase family 2 protein [Pseudomonadota bacterium]MBU1544351.1 glycosyltransferase family 2 protein [Pseudomonadota bacterium]MBU2429076.1 glycosyltransferase family 2 protein [Pseudomonadota bacterium]MBU2479906.1 glycosyltransferase family 2 protein [Pseudomonadota bacterium]